MAAPDEPASLEENRRALDDVRIVSVRKVMSWNWSLGGGNWLTYSELELHSFVWSKQKHGKQSAGETAAELNSSSMQMSADGLTTTMQSGTANVEPFIYSFLCLVLV